MCEKNKKPQETIELTDDQLEKAVGGFDFSGDPLPPADSIPMKQCPQGHMYATWIEKCPECGSDEYTNVDPLFTQQL